VIAGDIAGIAARDLAGQPGIHVPDARPPPVLTDGAFDLISGGGNAPRELRRRSEGEPAFMAGT
jgi:hypothetical protein